MKTAVRTQTCHDDLGAIEACSRVPSELKYGACYIHRRRGLLEVKTIGYP